MRSAFFRTLEEFYAKDKDMYILTGDLGYKLFDKFKEICPKRLYDMGIAEANMASVAAGLALCGANVYCYSIIPFLIMRAYEQIRVDIDYHDLNVKLVGVGGGFTYGLEGITHFGLEDFALMSSLQNMTVLAPADIAEAEALARLSYEYKGPMYMRLGRSGEPTVHDDVPKFEIGKAIVMKEGKDVAIFATGNMVYTGKKVVDILKKKGIESTLIDVHTIKPLDRNMICEISSSHDTIVSIEEHNVFGGLGTLIGEVLIEKGYNGRFVKIGIPYKLVDCIGNADHLRSIYGLTPDGISKKIVDAM